MNDLSAQQVVPAKQKFEVLERSLQNLIDRFGDIRARLEQFMKPDEKPNNEPSLGCTVPVQSPFLEEVDSIIGKINAVNDSMENVLIRLDI